MKYRKKPVIIEAVKIESIKDLTAGGSEVIFDDVVDEFLQAMKDGTISINKEATALEIATLEGVMTANIGDYIIKGIQGEYYPCKPDIFESTYEKA